jgi:hypothetical protein
MQMVLTSMRAFGITISLTENHAYSCYTLLRPLGAVHSCCQAVQESDAVHKTPSCRYSSADVTVGDRIPYYEDLIFEQLRSRYFVIAAASKDVSYLRARHTFLSLSRQLTSWNVNVTTMLVVQPVSHVAGACRRLSIKVPC